MPIKQLIRYLISGGTSTLITLCAVYIAHDVFSIHYLSASVIANIFGICTSFTLQKLWTFRNTDKKRTGLQGLLYLTLFLVNISLNTLIMYILVDLFSVWYIASQIVASGIIAISSFFIYKYLIFTHMRLQ